LTISDLTNLRQAVYKGVRSWSRRTLEKAGERVMDVPLPGEDNDTDGPVPDDAGMKEE
jgi:hypothetical protein